MGSLVLSFEEIDKTQLMLVGGKGLNLGELSSIHEAIVPKGVCVTSEAYQKAIAHSVAYQALVNQLSLLKVENREQIRNISDKLQQMIIKAKIPHNVVKELAHYLSLLGNEHAYAIRSSATAEDLPYASFAGQHESYLNIVGVESILQHISKCWASLFTERAIIYRIQNGFDHSQIYLSVVIQKMVFPQASGILFTADPISSSRKLLSIEASFGLGEAVVSGLVSADLYNVREETIVKKHIAAKKIAIHARKEGGVETQHIAQGQQQNQALTDQQIIQLARIGKQIEAHFGCPQDIEWCLADNTFYIVQSRPITTLFPIPETNDQENRVYVSVGHQQMMTDPIKPLGLSFFLLTTFAPMRKAGGRLFVDVTNQLSSPASRESVLKNLGQSDPLIKDALMTLINRGDFIKYSPHDQYEQHSDNSNKELSLTDIQAQFSYEPTIVNEFINSSQTSIEKLKEAIQTKLGAALFDFIQEDIQQFKKSLFDPSHLGIIMGAMNAAFWLNAKMNEWLGEKNVADTLSQSVPNNITSEMGLALLDVADTIRPYPEVIRYLQQVKDAEALKELVKLDGGQESLDAIISYLNKYGMRCTGEIDITRTRWTEDPTSLIPIIVGYIKTFKPGESKRKFEQGKLKALDKERELLERLLQLPDGENKAAMTKHMIDFVRNFTGYREYPKYSIVNRYFVYKQALLKEAEQLVKAGIIQNRNDVYYLTFEEFHEAVRTREVDNLTIRTRKEEYKLFERLIPPRVITSDGEIITGEYNKEHLPANALAGLPVSSGTIEGRARILITLNDATLEDGDILVTAFTDPSWTPLFLSIKGLVTEVGGLMTHGAVIAREYGLPAVVGVVNATKLIKDGQRIRLNGTDGYVELL